MSRAGVLGPVLAAASLAASAAGCATVTHARAPGLDARTDRRVAVLPFADRHDGDHPTAVPLAGLVDALPVVSDPWAAAPHGAGILRARVHAELAARTRFELVPLPAVDAGLAAAGLDVAAIGSLDAAGRAAAARRLGEATGADTLVFGDVTAWGREFWGVQSHATVGLALELREAATGAVLFSADAEDTEHSGVSQLPLPLATDPLEVPAWVVIELLRGLSTSHLLRLADEVAALAIGGLGPAAEEGPGAAPRLEQVAVSADGPLAAGELLVVVARGSPGALAAFRLGRGGWRPMVETAPGTYRGSAVCPRAGWPASRVAVRLLGEGGRADEARLPWPGVGGP